MGLRPTSSQNTDMADLFANPFGSESPDQTALEPETPAPVFALRAFKSTIFGSPQDEETRPVQRKPLPQKVLSRPTELRKQVSRMTPLKSPSKSILMTPGTRRSERKMVAFRDAPSRKLAADKSPANKEQLKKEEGLAQRRSDAAAGVESQSSPLRSTSRSPLKDIETQVSPSPKQRTSKLRHVQSPASTTKEHPRSRTSREATRAQAP